MTYENFSDLAIILGRLEGKVDQMLVNQDKQNEEMSCEISMLKKRVDKIEKWMILVAASIGFASNIFADLIKHFI